MTARQIKKLHTILAKLEKLEIEARASEAADYLAEAKNRLLDALRAVSR
jgi:hypothetical protein